MEKTFLKIVFVKMSLQLKSVTTPLKSEHFPCVSGPEDAEGRHVSCREHHPEPQQEGSWAWVQRGDPPTALEEKIPSAGKIFLSSMFPSLHSFEL